MLSLYTYRFLEPEEEVMNYILKLFHRNIFNFPTNIFFKIFRLGVTVANFVFRTTAKEKITWIKIRRKRWPNTTADNFVPEDIGQSLSSCI
jgi:hypothetical protein